MRFVIDYGCMAYDNAAAKTKAKLDRLQGQALRSCCGSLHGTARALLHVKCGQPALSLRRRRLQSDYAVEIRSVRDHPTASIMKDCWQDIYATYQPDREPFLPTYPKSTGNSIVYLAACGDEVSSSTSEADLPTDRESDDVTLEDGLEQ